MARVVASEFLSLDGVTWLFDEADDATTLKLVGTITLGNGAVILTYQPAAKRGA
jgi:hypothetical protein